MSKGEQMVATWEAALLDYFNGDQKLVSGLRQSMGEELIKTGFL